MYGFNQCPRSYTRGKGTTQKYATEYTTRRNAMPIMKKKQSSGNQASPIEEGSSFLITISFLLLMAPQQYVD